MDILKVKNNQRYWVVRAGHGAEYFTHFQENGLVAIGHMDGCGVTAGSIGPDDVPKIDNLLNSVNKEKGEKALKLAQVSKAISTIRVFVSEIQVGDVILTPKDNLLSIGTVCSKPYAENTDLFASKHGVNVKSTLRFSLRRKVNWETIQPKDKIPWPVNDSLRSSQTIFSLNGQKHLLEHWLYGMFYNDYGLHFSTRIGKKEDISSFHIIEFQRNIQKLELVAELLSAGELNLDKDIESVLYELEQKYQQFGMQSGFNLTTKQSVTSPGNIWSTIKSDIKDNKKNLKKILMIGLLIQLVFSSTAIAANDISYENLSEQEKNILIEVAEIIKNQGHFKEHKKKLSAILDKPKRADLFVEEVKTPISKPIIFPKVKKEGDTGK
jgi:hypothetical protein